MDALEKLRRWNFRAVRHRAMAMIASHVAGEPRAKLWRSLAVRVVNASYSEPHRRP
jgi:hypothetical protein